MARGPMAPVTANMGSIPDADVRAIATYVVSQMGEPSHERKARADQVLAKAKKGVRDRGGKQREHRRCRTPRTRTVPGAAIYASACSTCHDSGRPLPNLAASSWRSAPPCTAQTRRIRSTSFSTACPAPEGQRGPIMPGLQAF